MSKAVVQYTVAVPVPLHIASYAPAEEPSGTYECVCENVKGRENSPANKVAQGLTLRELKDSWPFDGKFHFRGRACLEGAAQGAESHVHSSSCTHVWMDLINENDVVPAVDGVVQIRALPLFPLWQDLQDDYFDADPDAYEAAAAQMSQRLYGQALSLSNFPIDCRVQGAVSVNLGAGSAADASGAEGGGSFWDTIARRRGSSVSGSTAPPAAARPFADDSATAVGPKGDDSTGGRRGSTAAGASGAGGTAGLSGMMRGFVSAAAKNISKAAETAATAAAVAAVSAEKKGWLSGLSKGMSALAKAAAGAAPASDAARTKLLDLSDMYNTPFTSGMDSCDALLVRLARAAFPDKSLPSTGSHWLSLGFSEPDPAIDLHIAGTLGIRAIVYFAETYGSIFRALVAGQADAHEDEATYRPAIALLILADRLAASLSLRRLDDVGKERTVFWELFATSDDIFFELFTMTARYFDHVWWTRTGQDRKVDAAIQDAVTRAHSWLAAAPANLDQLRQAADADGVGAPLAE